MKPQSYDLIGDIHGQNDKLTALLKKLGYQPHSGSFRHSEGHKVIFLGDYDEQRRLYSDRVAQSHAA